MQHGKYPGALREVPYQQFRHGNFVLRGLGQRYADRVADAVAEQRPDTYGALDTPLDAAAGLGDAQVDRIVHILGIHRRDQQPVSGDHDARVARLHRHDDLVESVRLADTQELHGRDDHALRRISPLVEDTFGERPVVDADAQGDAPLAAAGDQLLQLPAIRAVIARVDAHLVDILRGNGGHLGQEVDVGHDGRIEALVAQAADDAGKVLALAPPLCRKAHDLSPGAVDPFDLRHAGFGIVGVGVGHRLHGDRVPAADHDPPDAHLATRAATVFRKIHLVCDCDAKIKIIRDFANSDLFPIFRIATTIPLPP